MNAHILSNLKKLEPLKPRVAASIPEIVFGGVTPFTTIDFPGRLAAVLYTQGCAWRCRYCHNAHLRPLESESTISLKKVISFLETRRGLLDGVVFCGGEPTEQEKLPEAMRCIQEISFQVALHTTGMYPERLRAALTYCDWVGMDIKAPFRSYQKVTLREDSGVEPRKSVNVVLQSGVDYEFRTTVHPAVLSEEDILEIARDLSAMGAKKYALQLFQSKGCLDETLNKSAYSENYPSEELKSKLSSIFPFFKIRR